MNSLMATMRVAQVSRPGGPLELVERPIPDPGPGSVRIKVQACGVCHSDVFTKEGQWPGITFPRVPGHEVVRLARLPVAAVLRTRTISETRGVMKALVEAQSDRILGFTMLGPEAGEVMAIVQTAMLAGMPYPALRDAIFTHPTMAEGLVFLFGNVPPGAAR